MNAACRWPIMGSNMRGQRSDSTGVAGKASVSVVWWCVVRVCVCMYECPHTITLRAASGFHSSSRESPEKGSIGLNPRSGSELMDGTPYLC